MLVIAISTLGVVGCSQPKALVYQDLKNFRVQELNFQRATILLDLRLYNPNNYGLSLKNGDLDAYFNDKYLGKATLDERTAIPARDTFLLPVSVTADIRNIFSNALEVLTNGNGEVLVRLQGSVRAGKAGIFVGVPINYEGKQRIHF